MRIDIVTIFPDYLAPLDLSLIGKARRDGLLDVRVHDLRDAADDPHRRVDDAPFGGGAGMVMKPEPWARTLDGLLEQAAPVGTAPAEAPRLIVPAPSGAPFTQAMARSLATEPWLAFACGRYEGIDERVYEHAATRMPVSLVSLGDYVLNGGEVAALAMIEAIARLIPGVVGNSESLVEESHEGGLLEYPVYTRPATWDDDGTERSVPPVLLSGDHAAIEEWRTRARRERTIARRPDLLAPSAAVGSLADLDVSVAVPADLPELYVLTRAAYLDEGRAHDRFDLPPLAVTEAELADSLETWTTWVVRAPKDGVGHARLVGSVRARERPGEPGVWEIGRLMLAPDLRGRGLGRALFELAEGAAPDDVVSYFLETGEASESNLRRYRRAGYRRLPSPGDGVCTVQMVKRRA